MVSNITKEGQHNPVMVNEVIEYLKPFDGGVYFDGTVGMGGHTKAILDASAPGGRVVGVDLDYNAVEAASDNLSSFGDRVKIKYGNYLNIVEILSEEGLSSVDGIVIDLGLGTHQLSSVERGFSIELGGPLDMRYDSTMGISAKEVINRFPQRELEVIFRELGEEWRAKAVAREIVKARTKEEIKDAHELSTIIKRAVAKSLKSSKVRMKIHPATKTFMALRIFVNKELDNLEAFLPVAITALKEGGVIVAISFHSLEDRIVKTVFRRYAGKGGYKAEDRWSENVELPCISILTKKPIIPNPDEVRTNRRARSAKMRAARRISHGD